MQILDVAVALALVAQADDEGVEFDVRERHVIRCAGEHLRDVVCRFLGLCRGFRAPAPVVRGGAVEAPALFFGVAESGEAGGGAFVFAE